MSKKSRHRIRQFPVLVERDEDGFYVAECPVLPGCYTQGQSLDEALTNIHEVIELCLEEEETQKLLESYKPAGFSFHTVVVGA